MGIPEDEQPLQDGDALSVAEAYPDAEDTSALLADDVPAENEIANEEYPVIPVYPVIAPVAPQQDVPVAPVKKNKKKVVLADPAPVEAEDDEEDYAPTATKAGRPSAAAQPWPQSFFPMNFGSTSGGAIAVANSFSTGKGGTATSHATAYGSSAAIKKRRQN